MFQGDGVPFGGTYAANFLMDNCEVWAGYLAAEKIWSEFLADQSYANSMACFRTGVLADLEALWEPATGTYKYVYGLASMTPAVPANALFRPLCMSQTWPHLWRVPLDADRRYQALDCMQANCPHWWARNDLDDILDLGAHLGLLAANPQARLRSEILDRVEYERLAPGQADLYVMDAAYCLVIRDTNRMRDLAYQTAGARPLTGVSVGVSASGTPPASAQAVLNVEVLHDPGRCPAS